MNNLGLIIQDTQNLNTFKVSDASVYASDITNGILDITPPSLSLPTFVMRVEKNFTIVLNPSNLKIAPLNGVDFSPLLDGNYNIKYSVAPNQTVYIQYYYFRNLNQLFRWKDSLCNLYSNKCNLSSKDFYNFRRDMLLIKQNIDAAKYMAEDKHDVFKANELYSNADDLLSQFDDKLGCLIT